ncbi:hypothetical protein TorRG33x02_250340, partial [Trema orientale]
MPLALSHSTFFQSLAPLPLKLAHGNYSFYALKSFRLSKLMSSMIFFLAKNHVLHSMLTTPLVAFIL